MPTIASVAVQRMAKVNTGPALGLLAALPLTVLGAIRGRLFIYQLEEISDLTPA